MNLTVTCGGIPPSQVLGTIETSGWQHFPGYSEEAIDLILRNRHLNWDDPVTVHNYLSNIVGISGLYTRPSSGASSSPSQAYYRPPQTTTYPTVIGINSSFVFPAYDPKLVEEYINRQVSFVEPSEPTESSWEDISLPKDIFITVAPIDGVIEWEVDNLASDSTGYTYLPRSLKLFFYPDCTVKFTFQASQQLGYEGHAVNTVQSYYFITDYVLLPKFVRYNAFLEQSRKPGFEVLINRSKKFRFYNKERDSNDDTNIIPTA